ncbi:ribosomal RNA small subunit methyltransferase G [Polymorphobacter glacialis]|uniref:Ribosomal RNA small subunit methyltransferase G n=1 Tax=Sandarakinorhabdus glacialis TaxID=1614636 RepID=A0A917E6R3_9SPHN|nr:16S rRNA (guanine(527)-N(7))-methyltransferase RsmG [Polymorphobacter glacialis]GGE08756.1 ribosomal RNA small subunit methyltransferase G [Polymorphobacter glacialis]
MTGRDAFIERLNVPRETLAKLDSYAALLNEWQGRMNLVGPSTLPVLWERHFADSAQLLPLAGMGKSWLDIGAGAGFPGLIISILDGGARVTLVESIAKKCRFLTEVVWVLGLGSQVVIENRRIEGLPRQKFDVVTARALANLYQLFDWGLAYAGSGTKWLLPKGVKVMEELEFAERGFSFDRVLVPSITDPDARIVVASGVKRL